jgi:hypothetical protein
MDVVSLGQYCIGMTAAAKRVRRRPTMYRRGAEQIAFAAPCCCSFKH